MSRLSLSQTVQEDVAFRFHAWRRRLANFSLVRHRRCAGHLVSMHQAGTHWLKFMLASAIAHDYGIPGPQYNHANDIIGGPRDATVYAQIPRLLSSHSIPHPLLNYAPVRELVPLPPYVLLVRDLRAALVSNYEKWSTRYAVPFASFLHGDPRGRRYNSDIWWCFRFLNGWGELHARAPALIRVVRYEDLARHTRTTLRCAAAHLHLSLSDAAVTAGVAAGSKAVMSARHDPARPPGAVRSDERDPLQRYSADDRRILEARCERYLKYDFGYDFSDWSG